MRQFASGATRDTNAGKLEYARFLDSRVMRVYSEYMNRHRIQADGELRDPDNWKSGIPIDAYMDSLSRHYHDLWELYQHGSAIRPETGQPAELRETLCSLMFNVMGWLYEDLKNGEKAAPYTPIEGSPCMSDCDMCEDERAAVCATGPSQCDPAYPLCVVCVKRTSPDATGF